MKVYVVVQANVLGVISVVDVYEQEIDALRDANGNILRKVIEKDTIPGEIR